MEYLELNAIFQNQKFKERIINILMFFVCVCVCVKSLRKFSILRESKKK